MAEMLSSMLGIDKKEIDNQMLIIASLWKTAINSNNSQQIQAVREIREIINDNRTVNDNNRVQIINDLPEEKENETSQN